MQRFVSKVQGILSSGQNVIFSCIYNMRKPNRHYSGMRPVISGLACSNELRIELLCLRALISSLCHLRCQVACGIVLALLKLTAAGPINTLQANCMHSLQCFSQARAVHWLLIFVCWMRADFTMGVRGNC